MPRIPIGATALMLVFCALARAQPGPRLFVGAVAGISTLSADARSEIMPAGVEVSLYKEGPR